MLLDEATASLDIENELAVKRAIGNLLARRKTVIMIAHTLPIVRTADSIAVIGDGHVIEQGRTRSSSREAGSTPRCGRPTASSLTSRQTRSNDVPRERI